MNEQIITIIITVVGSGALSTLLVAWFNRGKTKAETSSIRVTGEVSIGNLAKDIANDLRIEVRAIREDMRGLEDDNHSLSKRLTELEYDNTKLLKRVVHLESVNTKLKKENEELKSRLHPN